MRLGFYQKKRNADLPLGRGDGLEPSSDEVFRLLHLSDWKIAECVPWKKDAAARFHVEERGNVGNHEVAGLRQKMRARLCVFSQNITFS
jgi:hypothetical protein